MTIVFDAGSDKTFNADAGTTLSHTAVEGAYCIYMSISRFAGGAATPAIDHDGNLMTKLADSGKTVGNICRVLVYGIPRVGGGAKTITIPASSGDGNAHAIALTYIGPQSDDSATGSDATDPITLAVNSRNNGLGICGCGMADLPSTLTPGNTNRYQALSTDVRGAIDELAATDSTVTLSFDVTDPHSSSRQAAISLREITGNQIIQHWFRLYRDFMDELRRGLIPPYELQEQYGTLIAQMPA